MKKFHLPTCIGFIIGSELLGSSGSFFTTPAIPTWYQTLVKSPLNPPSWVFAPAWTILFALMGTAVYLVWRVGMEKKKVRAALTAFGIQFLFNILWSLVFFGLRSPWGGVGVIIILWGLIFWTIKRFMAVDRTAGLLLIPYIAWVTFATHLNISVALLN